MSQPKQTKDMAKKNKKKTGAGAAKTEAKAGKKALKQQKKKRDEEGEDDIDALLAEVSAPIQTSYDRGCRTLRTTAREQLCSIAVVAGPRFLCA
jgi:hypothetical protein